MNFSKKWLAAVLAVLVFALPTMHVFAQDPMARNLSVFRVDGEDAFLTWGHGGRGMEPRDGQRLNAGNVMSTGLDTQVYMQLDGVSIVKMDEQSQVSVSQAGNRLSLNVFSGSALVEVEQQAPGHTLETRIGSAAMSVRGTLFIAGFRESGEAVFTMLSGYGVVYVVDEMGTVVEERPLQAGYVFWAYDYAAPDEFAVRSLDLQIMSLFELQETWNYREYLIDVGTITPDMLQQLQHLISLRQAERDAVRAAWDAPVVPVPAPDPTERHPIPNVAWTAEIPSIITPITNTVVNSPLRIIDGVTMVSMRVVAEYLLMTNPAWYLYGYPVTIYGLGAYGQIVVLTIIQDEPLATIADAGVSRTVDIASEIGLVQGTVHVTILDDFVFGPLGFVLDVFEIPHYFDATTQTWFIGD